MTDYSPASLFKAAVVCCLGKFLGARKLSYPPGGLGGEGNHQAHRGFHPNSGKVGQLVNLFTVLWMFAVIWTLLWRELASIMADLCHRYCFSFLYAGFVGADAKEKQFMTCGSCHCGRKMRFFLASDTKTVHTQL